MLRFTLDELAAAVEQGQVTCRPHPTLPLNIYNYTPKTQYSSDWNNVTVSCRGLILNHAGGIVARPWDKFFNLGQVESPITRDDRVEVVDKADGSLGILYPHDGNGGHSISTRGSFESEQAKHATAIWQERYSDVQPNAGFTFLFEIVYPENRIVLNYDGLDDLILLGAVHNHTGYYYGSRDAKSLLGWDGPVVEVLPFTSINDALDNMERTNAEGYVVRSGNFMTKLKQEDYLELHRLVTNISPKNIWLQLADNKTIPEICSILPDEFHGYVKEVAEPLLETYIFRFKEVWAGFHSVIDSFMSQGEDFNRGGFARSIANAPDKAYYFRLLDGHPITDILWKELRPREETE